MYHISPRYIREGIGHLVEKEITTVIEVMDKAEVISEEAVFEVGIVAILEEIIVGIEAEKIGGLGHG